MFLLLLQPLLASGEAKLWIEATCETDDPNVPNDRDDQTWTQTHYQIYTQIYAQTCSLASLITIPIEKL